MHLFSVSERGISRTFRQIVDANLYSIIGPAQRKLTDNNQNYVCILFSQTGNFDVEHFFSCTTGQWVKIDQISWRR